MLFLGSGTFDGANGLTVEESKDQGPSWQIIGTVPQPEGIGLGEPYMVEAKSGKLVGFFRFGTSNLYEKFMYQAESVDGGRTWTMPAKTDILGYPAHMIRLPDDRILLVYGVRVPPFGERARISEDEGETWKDVFKLDVSMDRVHYLDQPPITDLCQIVEGEPGIFYIGARGHLLEYHLKDTPHYR